MAVEGRPRRWPWIVLTAIVLLIAGAAGSWAVLTVLRPAEDPLASTDHTYVEVTAGSVGASISLNTVAEWTQVPIGANQATGIVTSVDVAAGAEVAQGTALYSVGLRPVVAAEGDVPMFRQIAEGTTGTDVTQLQQMLTALGHYRGAIDGKTEAATTTAIKHWQKTLGLAQTGSVDVGDIIFLPQLPTRVALDPEIIHRGASLAGGEDTVLGLPTAPQFWIPATEAQAAMMPVGSVVEVTAPDGATWQGATGEQSRNAEDGTINVAVTGPDGATLCADVCASVPVSGQTTLLSNIVTVEHVEGLVVPSAALVTTAQGQTAVVTADDERVPVDIVASAKGMSVITGVDDATRVRIPVTDESAG